MSGEMYDYFRYEDLNFKIINQGETLAARQKFSNGYEISVITSLKYPRGTAYGEAFRETFECAIFNPDDEYVPLKPIGKILGFRSKGEISTLMLRCQAYGKTWEDELVKKEIQMRKEMELDD